MEVEHYHQHQVEVATWHYQTTLKVWIPSTFFEMFPPYLRAYVYHRVLACAVQGCGLPQEVFEEPATAGCQ